VGLGYGQGEVEGVTDETLTAVVGDAEEGTAVGLRVGVTGTRVAFLSVGRVDDAVTAVREAAIGSAGVGGRGGVVHPVVALFQSVDDSVTATWHSAVGPAGVCPVGVAGAQVAFLTGLEVSVTALETARGVAAITGHAVSVVTCLVGVDHSVAATWQLARDTARVSTAVGVVGTIVTGLAGVDDAVTAHGTCTVGTATVGEVGVVAPVVTLLGGVLGSETGTTHLCTVRGTPPVAHEWHGDVVGVDGVHGITLFTQSGIDDAVTAVGTGAGGTAVGVGGVGVVGSVVTLFAQLDYSVTAVEGAVGAAVIVRAVHAGAVITLFAQIGDAVTALGGRAVATALRGIDTELSGVTLFAGIGGAVTARGQTAIGTAGVGGAVVIGCAVVTLFEAVTEVGLVVSAFEEADGGTAVEVVSVAVVALLTGVDDAVTAGGQAARGAANAGNVSVSSVAQITSLAHVDHTVTASGLSAVVTAAVG